MTEPFTPPISDAEVVRLVQKYLGNDRIAVSGINWAPVGHTVVNTATGGLYRVSGVAGAGGQCWSLVVKVVQAGPTSPDDPAHWNYWQREALAYQSDIPYGLSPALTAPRLAGVVAAPAKQFLVMEDVTPAAVDPWPLAQDELLARRLGQWGALPLRAPWLSPSYLRGILRTGAMIMQSVDAQGVWAFPHIAREFPPDLDGRIRLLLGEAERLLQVLDGMPRVLCHCDAHRGNLMRRRGADGSLELVLLDWSTVGVGAPGEEIGHLFSSNVLANYVPPEQATDLAETLIAGYCQGLAEGGVICAEEEVRKSFHVVTALRSFGFALPLILRAGSDPNNQAAVAYAPRLGANVRALVPQLDAALVLL